MNKGEEQRRRLFEIYSDNLKNVSEVANLRLAYGEDKVFINEPIIICPLCMKAFTSAALGVEAADRLTIEHTPPKSVSGKGKILTCKICNQKHGKGVDHHIEKQMLFEPFLKGANNSNIMGKIKVGDNIPLHAKLSYRDGTLLLTPHLNKRTKEHYYRTFEEMKKFKEGSKINMTFRGSNYQRYHLSLLKCAYLEMFSYFGHLFLFNNNTQMIRKQINNLGEWILPHSSVLNMDFDKDHVGVNVLYKPKDKLSFLVILDLNLKKENLDKRVGVLIPGPTKSAWESYSSFKDAVNFNCTLAHLEDQGIIKDKDFCIAYNEIWKKFA